MDADLYTCMMLMFSLARLVVSGKIGGQMFNAYQVLDERSDPNLSCEDYLKWICIRRLM